MFRYLKLNNNIKFRYEYWGGLCWISNGSIFRLNFDQIKILSFVKVPRKYTDFDVLLKKNILSSNYLDSLNELINEEIVIASKNFEEINLDILENINEECNSVHLRTSPKPFWVHIQPFTFCNQNCIHCYCDGGNQGNKFILSLEKWYSIIDKLDEFGILDVYITGGENLILEECFLLTDYIKRKGIGTGLSTNAMKITDEIVEKLLVIGIENIQVSLDGSTSVINDKIRGTDGAFEKTIKGINKLIPKFNVILNSVINKLNLDDIENIIKLGKSIGIKEFKFYPQKQTGRSVSANILITWNEWKKIPFNALKLRYGVEIDFLTKSSCGSAKSGFAVNEFGDVIPCIFGSHNKNLIVGNILKDNLEYLWFDSEKMNNFRNECIASICNRCEK